MKKKLIICLSVVCIGALCGAVALKFSVNKSFNTKQSKETNHLKLELETSENGTFEIKTEKETEPPTDYRGFIKQDTTPIPIVDVDGKKEEGITLYDEDPKYYTTVYGQGDYTLDEYYSVCDDYQSMFDSNHGLFQSDEDVTRELIKVRNLYRQFKFNQGAYDIIDYVGAHNFSGESDRVLEMYQLYVDASRILTIFDENTSKENALENLPYVVDPETNMLVTLGYEYGYETILNQECIGLYTNQNIVDMGEFVNKKDEHYYNAERHSSFDIKSMYRFKIKYNNSIDLYAYVAINSINCSHVYSFENSDGSFISPEERESIVEAQDETTVDYSWMSGIYSYQDDIE